MVSFVRWGLNDRFTRGRHHWIECLKIRRSVGNRRFLQETRCGKSGDLQGSSDVFGARRPNDLSTEQEQQLETFVDYLIECNKRVNLTAVKTRKEAFDRHVLDSLALLPAMEEHINTAGGLICHLMDVGSGAGLPGIVLAIARPEWQVVLLDSTKKRCDFAAAASKKCGAHNVTTIWSRAEDCGRMSEHREVYDVVTARAVAQLAVLVELCLPFLKIGGFLVAAKGGDVQDEVQQAQWAINVLGGTLVDVASVQSFSIEGQRTAVIIKKVSPTPDGFPRRSGIPTKRPLADQRS